MTALVQRGAPQDFLDIYQLCSRDVMSMADCRQAFTEKGLGIGIHEAKRKIIARLAMIEASRPLETIQPFTGEEYAALYRSFSVGTWNVGAAWPPPLPRFDPGAQTATRDPLAGLTRADRGRSFATAAFGGNQLKLWAIANSDIRSSVSRSSAGQGRSPAIASVCRRSKTGSVRKYRW
jgi:hypothetical protein